MRRLACWLPAVAWAGTLFWLSSRPAGPQIPGWFLIHDKLTHALAFGFLAALAYFAIRVGHRARPPVAALLAWCLATAYGGADEVHQSFVPTRQPDWYDWVADATGALVAVVSLWMVERFASRGEPGTRR